ncbi:hypothetical protein ACFY1U_12845 [Streptomyces sp. NPDC001351]|uniref:hypothetical protein n=1 Tax=Streptomyces sp. NPDC001351 TaxID=3364564 RepID=UPI0036784626
MSRKPAAPDAGPACAPEPGASIDHLLQKFNLIVRVPQATADGDALPRVGSQRSPDYVLRVAEDVVQEAWLRWQHTDRAAVREPTAFLTTVTFWPG